MCVCVCVCSELVRLSVSVGLAGRKASPKEKQSKSVSALGCPPRPPLPWVLLSAPSRSLPFTLGEFRACLCCPAPALKYLNPSFSFPLSSHHPSLPPSLSLVLRSTGSTRAVCALRGGLPPPSLPPSFLLSPFFTHTARISSLFPLSLSL